MAGNWGGKRPGTGPKPKRIKFPKQVKGLEKKLSEHAEKAAENVIRLADGGYERTTELWKPAGMFTKWEYVEKEGPRGGVKMLRREVPMFPDLEPDELVCIERKREIADADLGANKLIIERIAGVASALDEPEDEKKAGAKVTDGTRVKALETMKQWREKSVEQLASIKNPLTNQTLSESESTSEANTPRDSSTTDEF